MDTRWIITVFVIVNASMACPEHQRHILAEVSIAERITIAVVTATVSASRALSGRSIGSCTSAAQQETPDFVTLSVTFGERLRAIIRVSARGQRGEIKL
jgi:hypothetical protein